MFFSSLYNQYKNIIDEAMINKINNSDIDDDANNQFPAIMRYPILGFISTYNDRGFEGTAPDRIGGETFNVYQTE